MCRPRENNGVGLRRQHRLPVWFSWMKKVKATLRRLLVRSSDALDTAIQLAFIVSPRMIVLAGFATLVIVYFENRSR